jgi:uncharacterized protein (DUF2225 family)
MNITKALKELCPNCSYSVINEDYNQVIWNTNNPLPLPTKEIVEAKALEIQNRDAHIYKRANAYPSIQEQLDMQYWDKVNGTNTWEQAINAIKLEYPKN